MTYLKHDFKKFPELTNAQLEVFQLSSPHPQITEDFIATVVKVSDGDTIRVRTSFRDFDFPVRLLDIDSLELSEGGGDAKQWLKNKIEGKEIQVQIDSQNRVGKYGRLLGKVFFTGLDVGLELFHLGYAAPFGSKNESHIPTVDRVFAEGEI